MSVEYQCVVLFRIPTRARGLVHHVLLVFTDLLGFNIICLGSSVTSNRFADLSRPAGASSANTSATAAAGSASDGGVPHGM